MFVISQSLPRVVSRQKRRTRSLLSLACVAAISVPSISYGATFGTERLIDEDQRYLGEAMDKGGSDLEDAVAQVYSDFVASLVSYVSGVRPDAAENAAAAAGQIVPGMNGSAQSDGSRLTPSDRAMIQEASRRSLGDLEIAVQRVIFNQATTVTGFVASARPDLAGDVAYASTRAIPGSFRNVVHVLSTESVVNTAPSESASTTLRQSAARGVARAVSFEGVSEQRKIILADLMEEVGSTDVVAVSRTVGNTSPNTSSTDQPSAVDRLQAARGETGSVASITPTSDDSGSNTSAVITGTEGSTLNTSVGGSNLGGGFSAANSALFAQAGIAQGAPSGGGCDLGGAVSTADRARLRTAAGQGGSALNNEVRAAIQDRGASAAGVVSMMVREFPATLNGVLRTGVRARPDEASSMVCAAAESAEDVSPAVLVVVAINAGAENVPALVVAASRGSGTPIRAVLTAVSSVANLRGNELQDVVSGLVDMGHGGSGDGSADTPGSLGNPLLTPTVVAAVEAVVAPTIVGVDLTISYTSPN